jgi:ABC-type multidrug transport system ATPase subunit
MQCRKTTLLNLIAGHAAVGCVNNTPASNICKSSDGQYSGNGEILFNDTACESQTLQSLVAYVQQFDFHYPLLTVMETFQFHASLKFGKKCDDNFKMKKISRLVRLLGLSQCQHTRVGGPETKGISGGECRRLSIGIQLLKDPSVCVLDEPTTGEYRISISFTHPWCIMLVMLLVVFRPRYIYCQTYC